MKYMEIDRISCVGANERLSVSECIDFLLKNPRAELGIGVTQKKGGFDTERFEFISRLLDEYRETVGDTAVYKSNGEPLNLNQRIGLHLNGGWATRVANGDIPPELQEWTGVTRGYYGDGERLRFQLNLAGDRWSGLDGTDSSALNGALSKIGKAKVVVQYDGNTAPLVKKLNRYRRSDFDILYDSSYGFGKVATQYQSVFPNRTQGYAGGLSPDNIKEVLDKIFAVQPENKKTKIYVDAEGKLKNPDDKVIDLGLAQDFVDKTLEWEAEQKGK